MTELIDTTEMYLKTIYELDEEGIPALRARIAERLGHSGPTVSQTIARMERDGLVTLGEDRHLTLTGEGRQLATRIERKHRLAERLLVELNHRVMNTLAMIASIARMEAGQLEADSAGRQGMARLQSRLAAVSALYRALNNAARVNWVAARPYLSQVVDAVAASVADAAQITLRTDIAAVDLPTAQAAPLGLLVNELMTNAMKYAFPDGRHGILSVTLALADGRRVEAVTYVMRPDHWQYAAGLSPDEQAAIIALACGGRGPNADYLYNTVAHLAQLGIPDDDLADLAARVRALRDAAA